MRKLLLLLLPALMMCACASPAHNKYEKAMAANVLQSAPGDDKSVYKFTVLDMKELPGITLEELKSLRPHLDLPPDAPESVTVMRTRYQTTDPKSGSILKEYFDFYLSPDGAACYVKVKVRE